MILRTILFSIEAICSVLLITIILMQKAKGGGLGVAFGAGMSENLFGSRTGNVLTKATVVLAIVFMVNTVGLAILFARSHDRTLMDAHMPPPGPPPGQAEPAPPADQLPAVPATEGDMQQPTAPAPDQPPPPAEQLPAAPAPDAQPAPMEAVPPVDVELPEE